MCNEGKGGADKPRSTEISFRQSPFCNNPLTAIISEKTAVLVTRVETSLPKHPGVDIA